MTIVNINQVDGAHHYLFNIRVEDNLVRIMVVFKDGEVSDLDTFSQKLLKFEIISMIREYMAKVKK